jgi:hypothetical protein
MPRWQDVTLCSVVNVSHISIRARQRKYALLLSVLQKVLPNLLNLRPEAGLYKVINSAPDDLIPLETQQPAGTGVGVQIIAVAIRDQNGFGRIIENCLEQQLQFL